jgi:hypothetical protein
MTCFPVSLDRPSNGSFYIRTEPRSIVHGRHVHAALNPT